MMWKSRNAEQMNIFDDELKSGNFDNWKKLIRPVEA